MTRAFYITLNAKKIARVKKQIDGCHPISIGRQNDQSLFA